MQLLVSTSEYYFLFVRKYLRPFFNKFLPSCVNIWNQKHCLWNLILRTYKNSLHGFLKSSVLISLQLTEILCSHHKIILNRSIKNCCPRKAQPRYQKLSLTHFQNKSNVHNFLPTHVTRKNCVKKGSIAFIALLSRHTSQRSTHGTRHKKKPQKKEHDATEHIVNYYTPFAQRRNIFRQRESVSASSTLETHWSSPRRPHTN